ncbi:hypothetical protein L596_010088 [Steinernema carpocapsae]|uniref:Uncharacterized protein n=1 Tax=Steinernema carpocapsae TaxID=34508 RepID=A0A4V6A6S7_STECR|nr:hypothetical protein L596_010088 [Steinernema carpocapsae]
MCDVYHWSRHDYRLAVQSRLARRLSLIIVILPLLSVEDRSMTLMFAFVLRTVLLLSQSTVFFVFSQLLFAGRCFEWLLLLLDGFMFGLQLGAWELDLCCSIASNFLRHDNITGFEQAMVVSDLACVSRFTLLFLRIIITGVGQKQGTRGRHCNKIEARRRFNKEELNIYDVVKADIVTEMELVHKKLDNVMTELRKQLIAQPMPPAAPAAPAPPTRAGPPPPPPPPPPPAFFAPRPVEIKVAKKMAAKSNETRNTARAIDMSEVLKEMGNVTLRRVSRSPGGTPRRASLPNGVKIADLVDRGRKEILAKARASRRLSVTSFGAGDVV